MIQNPDDFLPLLVKFVTMIKDILLGGVGGIVAYMFDYTVQKDKNHVDVVWNTKTMFINCFIGAFVAYSLGSFIPHDIIGRDGIIGMIGVSSFAILGIVERKLAQYVVDRLLGQVKG